MCGRCCTLPPVLDPIDVAAPLFSVVVPSRARLPQLRACLRSLANLNFPTERYEVIVVNDGATALPEGELRAFGDTLDIVAVDQPWAGPATARNNGVMRARGAFVAFTDDDCTVAPDWLSVLEAETREHPDALLGGRAINALDDNSFATASQMLVDYLYEYYHRSAGGRGPRFFASNNMCARTGLLRQLGGFDTSFRLAAGEDRDLCDRWMSAGFELEYCPDAVVHHRHGMTFRSFTRQHLNYGRGAWAFHAARARRISAHIRIEPLRFYSGLVMYPLTMSSGSKAALLILLLAWSQVVNAAGFFMERARAWASVKL